MLLSHRLKFDFDFNLFTGLNTLKQAVTAPIKHLKAANEPSGNEYSIQTNLTA